MARNVYSFNNSPELLTIFKQYTCISGCLSLLTWSFFPGCKVLYRQNLAKSWGKHCKSCEYCYSMSEKLVTAMYGGSTEEFCSEDCRSKYTMLFCHVSQLNCSKIFFSKSDFARNKPLYSVSGCEVRHLWPKREAQAESPSARRCQTLL